MFEVNVEFTAPSEVTGRVQRGARFWIPWRSHCGRTPAPQFFLVYRV